MPIYEYRCQECQQTFEEWQKDFSERQTPCPVCGGKAERLISSSSFVLKGGGWYNDLYSKPAEAKPSDTKKTDSAGADSGCAASSGAKAEAAPCPGPCASSGGGCAASSGGTAN